MKEKLPVQPESAGESPDMEELIQQEIERMKTKAKEAGERGWAWIGPVAGKEYEFAKKAVLGRLEQQKRGRGKTEAIQRESAYIASEGLTDEELLEVARKRIEKKEKGK